MARRAGRAVAQEPSGPVHLARAVVARFWCPRVALQGDRRWSGPTAVPSARLGCALDLRDDPGTRDGHWDRRGVHDPGRLPLARWRTLPERPDPLEPGEHRWDGARL